MALTRKVRVCDIHFYNFIPEGGAVVWVIVHSPVTTKDEERSAFFLVVHRVEDLGTLVRLKNLARDGDSLGLCAVEMGLRWENALVRTLLEHPSSAVSVAVGEDDVATAIEVVSEEEGDYLVGVGHLEVNTKAFNRIESVGNDAALLDPEFYDLAVTITTSEGVYSYPRAGAKRKKNQLTIWDVFQKRDLYVKCGDTPLRLRIPVCDSQVFYVNGEAVWNGGLGEFFRMFYETIYDSFSGSKPLFLHVKSSYSVFYPFPGFPAFPFLSLYFECDSFGSYARRRQLWMLSNSRVSQTGLAAMLSGINCERIKIPGWSNPITPWSVNTSDLNGKLLDEESDSIITVNGQHTVMILDFRACFLKVLPALEIEELADAWTHLPEEVKNYLNSLISECISTCLQFSKMIEGKWVYITGREVCLLMDGLRDSEEVTEMFSTTIGRRCAENRNLKFLKQMESSVYRGSERTFMKFNGTFYISTDQEEVDWWQSLLPWMLHARHVSDEDALFERLIPLLFRKRAEPYFWRVSKRDLEFFPDMKRVLKESLIASKWCIFTLPEGYQEWSDASCVYRINVTRYLVEMDKWLKILWKDTRRSMLEFKQILLVS